MMFDLKEFQQRRNSLLAKMGEGIAILPTSPETIRRILLNADNRYAIHSPDTWPAQAALAASAQWKELNAWQDELKGGRQR